MRGAAMMAMAGWLCTTAAVAQEPRFDPAEGICKPYRPGVLDRQWQVSAPRDPRPADETVTFGLREKYGDDSQRLSVRARIVGSAFSLDSRAMTLTGASFADVEFPRDFPSARPLPPGPYTVIWVLADGAGFLACDGFVIR